MNKLPKNKVNVIRHYLLPYNKNTQTQTCGICGKIIHNYQGGSYDTLEAAENNGWLPGEHYVQGKNPTYFSSTAPIGNEYNIIICKISNLKTK